MVMRVIYARRVDECVLLDYSAGEYIWNVIIEKHPDVSWDEFFQENEK